MRIRTYLAAVAICASAPIAVQAATIQQGTVTVASLYSPTVNTATTPATFTANFGQTFEVLASGSYAGAQGGSGRMNGTLSFSKTVGATINQSLANFFTFDNDANGGNAASPYSFSVASVQTTEAQMGTAGNAFTLYLLGTVSNAGLNLDPTESSLTLQFNNTGGSGYATSATLSTPPAGAVPEPASWAMMLGGFGLMGGVLRRSRPALRTA